MTRENLPTYVKAGKTPMFYSLAVRKFSSAGSSLSALASASCYGRAKDVCVEAVVVPELEFRHVEWQMFLADLMKRPDHTALEDRPEPLDGVGMHRADYILPLGVINDLVRIVLAEFPVAHPLIGDQQTHIIRYGFIDKAGQGVRFHIGNHASYDIALPLDSAHDHRLARSRAARAAVTVALMPVLGFPTDKGFINLNDPHELSEATIVQSNSDPVAHVPSRSIGAHADSPIDLQGAHALLAGQHHVHDAKPRSKRIVCVLKDCADQQRESVASGAALCALPMIGTARQRISFDVATARTGHAFRPTMLDQKVFARIFCWKQRFKIIYRHLLNAWPSRAILGK